MDSVGTQSLAQVHFMNTSWPGRCKWHLKETMKHIWWTTTSSIVFGTSKIFLCGAVARAASLFVGCCYLLHSQAHGDV
eukprot:5331995-Amphidinium_carterae.2